MTMIGQYECPFCHRPLGGASEVCNGTFTERDHPIGVQAVKSVPPDSQDSEEGERG